jgi:hypothetical protein
LPGRQEVQSAFYLVGNILNTQRKTILEGKAVIFTNNSTGKLVIYPCKSARLGINGLISRTDRFGGGILEGTFSLP